MIEEGKRAPAFKLASSDGGDVSLSSFKGKPLIVYFYPRDDTPGCTLEAKDFQAEQKRIARLGAAVVGISRDSIESHCKFRDKYGLAFPLLSDPDHKVIEAYGAWGEKNMYGKKSMGIVRTTALIDADGKVARLWRKVKVAGHVDEVIEALQALKDA